MERLRSSGLSSVIGKTPFRIALAGGWIDQPFVSMHNPEPPGSMVVVNCEPSFRYMDRCGFAGSTRKVIERLWNGSLPDEDPSKLVREIYEEENRGKSEPSGSQDMIGLVYPGVNRLDFDHRYQNGVFPAHIESCTDPDVARWLERVVQVLPIAQRPPGYDPLGVLNLDPVWIARLGRSGRDCFDAIVGMDARALGESMNECMRCWEAVMPRIVRHPLITVDLMGILGWYQERYDGAMFSGCGGGCLFVVSEEEVPGAFRVNVRTGAGTEAKTEAEAEA